MSTTSEAAWFIIGVCVGGVVMRGVVTPLLDNPEAPTPDDLEQNALITYQRDEFFVHVRGREIGYFFDYDEAVEAAFKSAKGLNVYVLEDDKVMLLSDEGEAVLTWPWAGGEGRVT